MKKMFMLVVSILAIHGSILPATMRQYQSLMKIIAHDDAGAFKTFLGQNPDFTSNNAENLFLAPQNNTAPVVYMINNAAINCLRYALDAKLFYVTEPYKFIGDRTIIELAKSMAVDNPKAGKTLAFLAEYQSKSPQFSHASSKQDAHELQLTIAHIIDNDDARELEVIRSIHPDFNWAARMTGFVGNTKLPNMTPLAYAQWRKSADCAKTIATFLYASDEMTRPVSTARYKDELREKFAYNS